MRLSQVSQQLKHLLMSQNSQPDAEMFPSHGSMPSSEASQRQHQKAASPSRVTTKSQENASQFSLTPQSIDESSQYIQQNVRDHVDIMSILTLDWQSYC